MTGRGGIERFGVWGATIVLTLVFIGLAFLTPWAWVGVAIFGGLTLVGLQDVMQTKHAVLSEGFELRRAGRFRSLSS